MSAGGALQEALASALAGISELTGVFDGPPPRAAFPYAAIDAGNESDWSHNNGDGREVLVAITVWDDQPARLHSLGDRVETVVAGVGIVTEWQLVTMRLLRRRVVREVAGPWAIAVDYRARLLAAS